MNNDLSSESSDDEFIHNLKRKVSAPATIPVSSASAPSLSKKQKKYEHETEEEKLERKRLKKERRQEFRQQKLDEKEKRRLEEYEGLGRHYTVSMAIPGSIIENAQSAPLKTYLAGQIARAAAIFQIDEIIIFDDQLSSHRAADQAESSAHHTHAAHANASSSSSEQPQPQSQRSNYGPISDCHMFLERILQYIETPQYLRRHLFPKHNDLRYAGLLNPLSCPHHMKEEDWTPYREGVTVDRPTKSSSQSVVEIGLRKPVIIDTALPPGVRVTIALDKASQDSSRPVGKVVSPAEPRQVTGTYWGYTTRSVPSLAQVWQTCPYKDGYDLKIGTSERGHVSVDDTTFALPKFQHLLIVFGGVAGIEACVDADETLSVPMEQSHELFDMWVNTCPNQGSRTIRTEEALMISMAALRKYIVQ